MGELMLLPYFDCVRFHIIDPMHNLFTGTAKHLMKNIWLDGDNPLLKKNDLCVIQEKLDKIKAPSDIGRMLRKILSSYGVLLPISGRLLQHFSPFMHYMPFYQNQTMATICVSMFYYLFSSDY